MQNVPFTSRSRVCGCAAQVQVRGNTKDRLLLGGLIIVGLPLVICSVALARLAFEPSLGHYPWAHMTIEACLNVLWVLLALSVVVHWVTPGPKGRRGRLGGLVSLAFVLSLLFPVISANDDAAQFDLINDAKSLQSITLSLKNDKQARHAAGFVAVPAVPAVQLHSVHPLAFDLVVEPAPAVNVAIPGADTGNHSPPLC